MTLGRIRLVPPLETYPRAIAAAQTAVGKLGLLAVFVALLSLVSERWPSVGVFLLLATLLPEHRRAVVAVGTVVLAFAWPGRAAPSAAAAFGQALVFLYGAGLYLAAHRFPRSKLFARPVLLLLVVDTTYLAVVGTRPNLFPSHGFAWGIAQALCTYQWFIAYALRDRLLSPPEPVWKQLGTFVPFWGSTAVPFPKGAANWRKIEARTPEDLAVCQLKGLKLMLWCVMLTIAGQGFHWAAYQVLGIPSMRDALLAVARDAPTGTLMSWASIFCNFLERIFQLAIFGHAIIAACRMAGFAALRNTYRPFEARDVADFWNRYLYYFKELLVEFFYYPSFLSTFKRHPRLRRIFAVFASACLGNIYYHLVRDAAWIEKVGFWEAARKMDVYAIQCIMLAVAISISQARRSASPRRGWLRARAIPLVTVVVSYCCMFAFVDEDYVASLRVHLRFFAHLFGIPA